MSLNAKHIYSSVIKAFLMVCTMSFLMTACSEDSSDLQEDGDILEIIPFTHPFTEGGQMQTRAIILPENYSIYSNLYPQASSEYASIYAYLISDNSVSTKGSFVYHKEQLEKLGDVITKTGWSSNIAVKQGKNYYIYGFMPASFSSSANVSQNNGSFENKAVITINGIDAVTPADVCVVTGVKGFDTPITNSETTGSVELGSFTYTGKAKNKNYIYLLLDHLFACINLEFSVDFQYSQLRKIILRNVTIAPSNNTPKRNLTVTINGSTFTVNDTQGTGNSGSANIYNEPSATDYIPVEVTGVTPLSVPGYFTPTLNSAFKITSTYDVYDTNDNLVREGCTAENTLQLNVENPTRGNCYTVKFVITPTYLYQLSEPDLDNPTIHVAS